MYLQQSVTVMYLELHQLFQGYKAWKKHILMFTYTNSLTNKTYYRCVSLKCLYNIVSISTPVLLQCKFSGESKHIC